MDRDMSFWTADNIKSVIGGIWLARERTPGSITGVCTDSRVARQGDVFVALRGERMDGHSYLRQAAAAGARLLILDRAESVNEKWDFDCGILQVPDTSAALLRLGASYRRTLDTTRVIAVGGSNGKTTTCKLLHAVLSRTLRGSVSPKSFNNAVGVPLTILAAKRSDQYLICEVGTNSPGEITPLADAVSPDIAVITSIGREHLEGLGSLRGVIKEESSLMGALRPGGLAVITAEPPALADTIRPLLAAAGGEKPASIVTFGTSPSADLRVGGIVQSPEGTTFVLNEREPYRMPLLGAHNTLNAAAVIAVARRMGVPITEIEAGLAGASGAEMRLERVTTGGVRFVNDAYNSNPESALAAIDTFREAFGSAAGVSRRVLILGDMLELGESAPDLHREVGEAAAGVFDLVVLVGQLVMFAGERLARSLGPDCLVPFPDAGHNNAAHIARLLRPGDAVLLKGSRRMGLERIIGAARESTDRLVEPSPAQSAPSGAGLVDPGAS